MSLRSRSFAGHPPGLSLTKSAVKSQSSVHRATTPAIESKAISRRPSASTQTHRDRQVHRLRFPAAMAEIRRSQNASLENWGGPFESSKRFDLARPAQIKRGVL